MGILISRGTKEVNYSKTPDSFAVRLTHGKAPDEKTLEALLGRPKTEIKHIDSVPQENMEIFNVKETDKLEDTMDELRKAPGSDVITHIYTLDDTPGGEVIPTGTMTIQFKPEVESIKRENILEEFGLVIVEELDFLPHGYTVKLTSSSQENPLKIAAKLQKRKEIETAEPDISFKVSRKYVPSDTLYKRQWHLKNRGDGIGLKAGADVRAEGAWDISRGSRDITVCVIDDGFDLEHPDFQAPDKIVAPRDFGQDDSDPSPVMEDDNHGTACAGLAIAEENGTNVVGLAPMCSFMPVRYSTRLSDESIMKMFQYAIDHHADVISCSWSAEPWNFPLSAKMTGIIHKAATQGRRNGKGCVILFAAGNENRPLDGEKRGKISHQGFALHSDVIAVAACTSLYRHARYSNSGEEIAICAPSGDVPGRTITTTDRRGTKGYSSGDYTHYFSGTSASTPIAAGLAALILSVNPDLTSKEVKDIMMETAYKIKEKESKCQYVDGHSPCFGHGCIDAHKAVAYAANKDKLPEVLYMEHRINESIPDMGELDDSIIFPLDVTIKDMEVNLDIKHTRRGDLQVILVSPQGNEIMLHDRSGGGKENLIRSIRSSDEPELFKSVLGISAKGNWHLKAIDKARKDIGMIRKWGVAITYQVG